MQYDSDIKTFFKNLLYLGRGYWLSPQRKTALMLFVAIMALTVSNVYIAVLLNEWKNSFYTALQNYNADAIFKQLVLFLQLAAVYIVISIYSYYLRQTLTLNWRKWLTEEFITLWMKNKNYYCLQTFGNSADNPDQRISEDCKLFVEFALKFTIDVLNAACTFASFIFILWGLSGVLEFSLLGRDWRIPGYVVWIALIYSILGTYITHITGRSLSWLNFDQQRYEADFRFGMMRLRENAESVAFYAGEKKEINILKKRFLLLYTNFKKIIKKEKQLIGIKSAYFQLANVFPVIVAVPIYLAKKINLGGLMQTASAFGKVQGSLSYFVYIYAEFAQWRAVVDRLSSFSKHIEEKHNNFADYDHSSTEGEIRISNMQLSLPNREILLKDLNFSITHGTNVIIKGANGSGKSTLMRALSGIWPYVSGTLELPDRKEMMFIPQKPYLPLGTLKDSLLYPANEQTDGKDLAELMEKCGIGYLAKDLDMQADWYQVLSVGEQQRLAFIRALLLRPKWLFLDESTSAMDEDAERDMYDTLKRELPSTTLISIGHRNTLDKYHKMQLTFSKKDNTFVMANLAT